MRLILCMALVMVGYQLNAVQIVLSREQIFKKPVLGDAELIPIRKYADLDLNNDGHKDLLVSSSLSLGGTGGFPFTFYLGIGNDRFVKMAEMSTFSFAVEEHPRGTRLWWFTKHSGSSGSVRYCFFNHAGIFQLNPGLEIYPGDGGTDMGRATLRALFNEKTILTLNDFSYVEKHDK